MIWMFALGGAVAAETPEGSPFPDLTYIHPTRLKTRKRVDAEFPPGIDDLSRHRCTVWVRVGIDGTPADVVIVDGYEGDGCTEPFQQAAKAAVQQWKWSPTKVEGEKSEVQTQIGVVFVPSYQAPPPRPETPPPPPRPAPAPTPPPPPAAAPQPPATPDVAPEPPAPPAVPDPPADPPPPTMDAPPAEAPEPG